MTSPEASKTVHSSPARPVRDGSAPGPNAARTVGDAAVDGIRRAILAGHLLPGQRLVEAELAQQFGGSRATARGALITLEAEGFVERTRNRGARVRVVSIEEAIELTEVRIALEGICAAKAAERATDDEIRELQDTASRLNELADSDDGLGYSELNRRLHERILELSRHKVARELVWLARSRRAVTVQFPISRSPHRIADSLQEHLDVIAAIASRDPDRAEQAMRSHLAEVLKSLKARAAAQDDFI